MVMVAVVVVATNMYRIMVLAAVTAIEHRQRVIKIIINQFKIVNSNQMIIKIFSNQIIIIIIKIVITVMRINNVMLIFMLPMIAHSSNHKYQTLDINSQNLYLTELQQMYNLAISLILKVNVVVAIVLNQMLSNHYQIILKERKHKETVRMDMRLIQIMQ